MRVWLNGHLVSVEEAALGVEDAGFQHGVGLFETMLAVGERVVELDAHLARMTRSARMLGLSLPNEEELRAAVAGAVGEAKLPRARVRLTVTPGTVSLLRGDPVSTRPTVLCVATPPILYDRAYYQQGVTVIVAGPLANPFDPMQGHKTLAYWGRLRTLREAAAKGAAEAIWLSVTNHLASGAVSNLLLVKDGSLLTPYARGEEAAGALPAPVLPGVTRAWVLQWAEASGIPVRRRMLSITDLLEADEVMLTNSSWGVLPVTRVEGRRIDRGEAGPVTRQLIGAYEALLGPD